MQLRCGGFIFAIRHNHVISNAIGFIQFINAVGEMVQGACEPSIPPMWQREILNARNPPLVTCAHHEFDEVVYSNVFISPVHRMAAALSSLAQPNYLLFEFEKTSLITCANLQRLRY